MRALVEGKGKDLKSTSFSAEFLDSKAWSCCLAPVILSKFPGRCELTNGCAHYKGKHEPGYVVPNI